MGFLEGEDSVFDKGDDIPVEARQRAGLSARAGQRDQGGGGERGEVRHVAGTLIDPQNVPGNTEQVVEPTRWRQDDQERTGDGSKRSVAWE